ncbi:probable serine carboxypeptidase CPVL, partial [Aplysia californica]|uniref:Probable serine carboxypeptidase CPVL n=1 Tax=Aplysia californica TaxID=6500 RepID=A0ABM0ZXF0_APLCA
MAAACSSPVSEGGSGGAGIECSPLYLSRLLGTERQDQAASLSRVCLPGLRQTSHSGYITVDHRHDSHLFFWFFPATKVAPDETQLIVYLNGGPGNSAMIGLFEEIGPITVDKNGELVERVTSWVDHYSVIFVDNPIGVGFSYSGGGGESKRNCDIANNLYSFLTQFLQLFPLYQKCDLY